MRLVNKWGKGVRYIYKINQNQSCASNQFLNMETLSKNQIQLLKRAFAAFEIEGKNKIPTLEIGTILEMLGKPQSPGAMQVLLDEFDPWNSGELDFNTFCDLASRYFEEEENPEAMQQELREAFRLYDKEGNGYITVETLREILSELDSSIPEDELDSIIDEIDADGSGTVDFQGNGYITIQVLRDLLWELDEEMSEYELDQIIDEIDADGSGTVDFDEFMEVMTGGDE